MADLNRYLMDQILLENGDFTNYQVEGLEGDTNPKRLENLGKINVFVGANNSGKSRLIRGIARNKNNVYELPKDLRPEGILLRDLHKIKTLFLDLLSSLGISQVFSNLAFKKQFDNCFNQTIKGIRQNPNQDSSGLIKLFNNLRKLSSDRHLYIHQPGISQQFEKWIENCQTIFTEIMKIEDGSSNFIPLYIPTLRTLRDLGDQELLKRRTTSDYNLENINVFTGQSIYTEVESLLRGNLEEREKLREFEFWLSETFFENKPVALIPKVRQTTLTIKIGDELEKPIHELGDGIQSILILTFELFRHQDEHVLAFIEEPELFLHPWLQRVFLEMLSSKGRFPKHQYFFTTHSNHFLDLTLDVPEVSVYTLVKDLDSGSTAKEKPATFTVRQISRENREPLELLGVRNSSVLLSNCTIWVEGITDRRYIAHWLYLYNKFESESQQGTGSHRIYKEDLHYSFVEYAGSNITHYSFLDDVEANVETEDRKIDVDWLCGRLFLITDQDGAKPDSAKGQRHSRLQQKLGNDYHCLQGREIENLIAPSVLMKVLQAYGEKEYAAPAHKNYLKKPLGTFLDSYITKVDPEAVGVRRYAQKKAEPKEGKPCTGATINDKTGFCHRAIEATKTWSDLSEEAQELTRKLYAFIQSKNT